MMEETPLSDLQTTGALFIFCSHLAYPTCLLLRLLLVSFTREIHFQGQPTAYHSDFYQYNEPYKF